MGPEEIQVVGNYSSINSLHPKVSMGPLDYRLLERAYTDEKRDEKPLGMKKNIAAPYARHRDREIRAKRATWPEIQAF
jgi:hypothetical protein